MNLNPSTKPFFVLVQFEKLVQLAQRSTPGLLRGVFIESIEVIKESMENSFSSEKFGRPTLNFRSDVREFKGLLVTCEGNEGNEFILQGSIPGTDILPRMAFNNKTLLEKIDFIDGRHRTLAAKEAFPDFSTANCLVICEITNMYSYEEMKQYGYQHSQGAATVENCFIDVFGSVRKDLTNGEFSNICKRKYGIKSSSALENLTKLRKVLFESSCHIISMKRSSRLFSTEVVAKKSVRKFVSLMTEFGTLQFRNTRYSYRDLLTYKQLEVKEHVQNMLVCVSSCLMESVEDFAPARLLNLVASSAFEALNEKNHPVIRGQVLGISVFRMIQKVSAELNVDLRKISDILRDSKDFCMAESPIFKIGNEITSGLIEGIEYSTSSSSAESFHSNEFIKFERSDPVLNEPAVVPIENHTLPETKSRNDSAKCIEDPASGADSFHIERREGDGGKKKKDVGCCGICESEVEKSQPHRSRSCDESSALKGTEKTTVEAGPQSTIVGTAEPPKLFGISENGLKISKSNSNMDEIMLEGNCRGRDRYLCGQRKDPTRHADLVSEHEPGKSRRSNISGSSRDAIIESDDQSIDQKVPKHHVSGAEVSTDDDEACQYYLQLQKNRKNPPLIILPGYAPDPEVAKNSNEILDQRSSKITTTQSSIEINFNDEDDLGTFSEPSSQINICDDETPQDVSEARYNLRKSSERISTEKESKNRVNRKRKNSKDTGDIDCSSKRRKLSKKSSHELQEVYTRRAKCARRCVLASHYELEKFSSRRFLADRNLVENLQEAQDHRQVAFFVDEPNLWGLENALENLKEKGYKVFSLTIVSDKLSNDFVVPKKISLRKKFVYTLRKGRRVIRRETVFLKEGEKCLLANREDILRRNPTLADVEDYSFVSTLSVISSLAKRNIVIIDFTQCMPGLLLKKTIQLKNDLVGQFLRIYAGNDENKDEIQYLDVIREKILSKCNCGGHAIITEENEDSLNESEYPNVNKGHDGPTFLLRQAGEDQLEMNVFVHNSILISKNLKNETPSFVNDGEKMCRVSHTECGTRLHGGLFMKCSEYSRIINHPDQEPLPLVYPGSFLVDYGTKVNYLENEISPFEMSDLYISGLTHRKLYFYWNTNSVASMVNEDPETEITFHPAYTDEQFLIRLYEKGAGELKKEKMALVCLHIEPAKMSLLNKKGRKCENCDSVELFGHYGGEYSHRY